MAIPMALRQIPPGAKFAIAYELAAREEACRPPSIPPPHLRRQVELLHPDGRKLVFLKLPECWGVARLNP